MSAAPLPAWAARGGAAVGGVVGAALALRPEPALRWVSAGTAPAPVWLVRLLGARMVAQAVVEVSRPDRRVLWGGAGIELAHGASMLAAAAIWPGYRRSATASAAIAFGFAGLGIASGWARP
jgi:hypothetical protein